MQLLLSVRRLTALFAVALVTCLLGLLPLAAPAGATTAHYYLALGDSVAFGYQPNGDWSHGYADQLLTSLRQNDQNMSLVNMGCWGETTSSFINGNCVGPSIGISTKVTYVNGDQLDTAKAFLQANGSNVKVVTLDVGLNDLAFTCFDPNTGSIDYTCVSQLLPVVQSNETTILNTLKSVASPSTTFLLSNTFDPLQNVLPNTILAVQELNQTIATVANQTHTPLVNQSAAFHMDQYPNGGNPYLCPDNAPLVWACTSNDTHPTTAGYTVMANTFYAKYENL